jgi:hypothetical protein
MALDMDAAVTEILAKLAKNLKDPEFGMRMVVVSHDILYNDYRDGTGKQITQFTPEVTKWMEDNLDGDLPTLGLRSYDKTTLKFKTIEAACLMRLKYGIY